MNRSKSLVARTVLLVVSSVALAAGVVGSMVFYPGTFSGNSHFSAAAAGGLGWKSSLSEGLSEAKDKNKYVLADVYTDWCGWCKKLDRDTFSDGQMVKYLKSKFVCVKVNAEGSKESKEAASKYNVHGFPCSLVFDSQGKFLGRLSGYMEPLQYQSALEDLIAHPTAK